MESLNANKDQCLVKYSPEIKSTVKYRFDQQSWEPEGNLVSTIYDYSNTFNKISGLDVSQDSKYFVTTSSSKPSSSLFRKHKNMEYRRYQKC